MLTWSLKASGEFSPLPAPLSRANVSLGSAPSGRVPPGWEGCCPVSLVRLEKAKGRVAGRTWEGCWLHRPLRRHMDGHARPSGALPDRQSCWSRTCPAANPSRAQRCR